MYACSPTWKADWISVEALETGLSQLAGTIRPSPWGEKNIGLNHGLHVTGGEPFLNFDLLLRAVEIAEEWKIPSTFVETNCFWCRDDEETVEKLRLLHSKGLRGILISVNPFHAEYVPFDRTERCVRISEKVFGRNVMVYQLGYYKLFKKLALKRRISLEECKELTRNIHLAENVELFLMGSATRRLKKSYPAYPASRFFHEPCMPPLLRSWHNHFDNYGNFMPGYCGGISMGCWYDLDALLEEGIDLDERPVLRFLVAGDTQGLFCYATDLGYQESGEGYISKCDLCLDLRKHLVSKRDYAELQPRDFYLHLE
jgi:hypothetical protein